MAARMGASDEAATDADQRDLHGARNRVHETLEPHLSRVNKRCRCGIVDWLRLAGADQRARRGALAPIRMTGHRSLPASSYQVLYSFAGGSDGRDPAAALINVNGTLYGTTREGGNSASCPIGCGTVYSITPSGSEKVVHSFTGPPDGAFPAAALIDVKGTLYGTTERGGSSGGCHLGRPKIGCGTVYSITPSGSETVLYRFISGSDAVYPAAGLVDVNGTLYGTTVFYEGGGRRDGAVYSVSMSGSEKVLYRFAGRPQGGNPRAGLIDVRGVLYSTTVSGGYGCNFFEGSGCGTAYRITTSGTEKLLHRFDGQGTDGVNPAGGLIYVHGTLYGTTSEGGANSCDSAMMVACGTVFSITTSGTEQVVHSFSLFSDGNSPAAGLLDVNGTLYGTTTVGGSSANAGAVFALTP